MTEENLMSDAFKSTISKISMDFEKISADLDNEKRKSEQILQKIQDNYSKMLEQIFHQKELIGQNFIDLLENKVPENIIENTREYFILRNCTFLKFWFRSARPVTSIAKRQVYADWGCWLFGLG